MAYSIGNFVFGAPGRFTPQLPGYGLVVTSEFDREGPSALEVRCVVTDNTIVDFQARPCDLAQATEVLTGLHPEIVMENDVGRLSLRGD